MYQANSLKLAETANSLKRGGTCAHADHNRDLTIILRRLLWCSVSHCRRCHMRNATTSAVFLLALAAWFANDRLD
jgi:hypothetical protein